MLGSSPVTSFITSFSAFYLHIFCPSSTLLPDPYPLPAHAFPAPLSTFTLWPVFLLLFLGILFLFRSTCMTIGFMHEYEGDGRGWLKVMVSFLSFCSISLFLIPYSLFFFIHLISCSFFLSLSTFYACLHASYPCACFSACLSFTTFPFPPFSLSYPPLKFHLPFLNSPFSSSLAFSLLP